MMTARTGRILPFAAPATIVVGLLFIVTCTTFAVTHKVPDDQADIQAAIDSSADGDTVLVAPGTYTGDQNRNLSFGGREITLLSEGGPELTVIDCESQAAALLFTGGESSWTKVKGFTIRNAAAGGIVCLDSSPVIVDCIIIANSPAGIICNAASPTINGCTIAGNESSGAGAGIYCYTDSSPTIVSCVITGNKAASFGGGIYCSSSSPFIVNSTISRNQADDGGGVCCHTSSSPHLDRSIVWGNCASWGPEVLIEFGSSLTFTCCAVDPFGVRGNPVFDGRQVHEDPRFCMIADCGSAPSLEGDYGLASDSPCLPQASPCGALIGANDIGCAETAVMSTTWGAIRSGFLR